jgi:hypothetical protein
MILRLLNLVVIGALVLAAAWVYRIKFDSTVQAEHLAKLRGEVRLARDKIAALRAEWSALDDPARIEQLAKRFLKLQPVAPTQFDKLDHLPDRAPDYMQPGSKDPIGGMIEHLEEPVMVTGSLPHPPAPPAPGAPADRPDKTSREAPAVLPSPQPPTEPSISGAAIQ